MTQDKFEDLLRSKLGEARIEPPADMWSRIASTLGEQGLTAAESIGAAAGEQLPPPAVATPRPSAIRRPRRLRWNAAAVAAVLLCAVVIGLRLMDFGKDETADLAAVPAGIELVALPQDNAQQAAEDTDHQEPQTIHETIRSSVAARMTGQTDAAHSRLVAQTVPCTAVEQDGANNKAGETTASDSAAGSKAGTVQTDGSTDSATAQTGSTGSTDTKATQTTRSTGTTAVQAGATDSTDTTSARTDATRGATTATQPSKGNDISSDMRTGEKPALPPIAEGRPKRRAAPLEIGVYGSNNAGSSTEKNFNTGPVRAASNQIMLYEQGPTGAEGRTETNPVVMNKLKHRIPVSFGLNVTKGILPRLAVESGVTYSYLYSESEGTSSYATAKYKQEQKLHFVGVPVGVKYNFVDKPWYGVYARGGALFEVCVSSEKVIKSTSTQNGHVTKDKYKPDIKGVLPSLNIHVGAEFNVSRHLGIYIEPGASYYFKDNSGVDTYWSENPFNFSVRAGIRVKL
ncbi:outer membrane beta-barrel protein [Alistipes sp. OttesenSCG-928-B03]|nr:outer membrane beta-barrel protein [Alistipes sp. OttesenSCG-928-B03]